MTNEIPIDIIDDTPITIAMTATSDPTSFVNLVDTPNSYSGQASKVVAVNDDEDGLEFVDSAITLDWGEIQGTLSNQTDLQTALDNKVTKNANITSATKTKITYDTKGLVTSGSDATTADIADSSNKRYVTDAHLIVIGNTSNTNTGDETQSTIKTKLGAATASVDGYLTSTDWSTFNGKQAALGYTPVPDSRTVNSKALTSNISIDKTDVGLSNVANTDTTNASNISSGTLDGDRLPALSSAKKGGVPATGTPSGKFLKDDGTWAAAGGGGTNTLETKTDTYNVSTEDNMKILVMNAATEKTFNLPSVTSSNVGLQFTFVKLSTGNLIIDAADSDVIMDSSAGGTITNSATETMPNLTLILVSETQWAIVGGSGTWVTA